MQADDPILAELLPREPIFHRPQFPTIMSDDYWEVGASGAIYTRDFILDHLARNPPVDAADASWQIANPQCRSLSENTWLLTYTLHQGDRQSRRATIWHRTQSGWQIIYHQGTLIAAVMKQ